MTQPLDAQVILIGGGPGAPDLITVRGLKALQQAQVIIADHLGPTDSLAQMVDLSGKLVIDASKLPYGKQMAQSKINELCIQHAQAGKKVARLKGGDPFVFGRGFEELAAITAAGLTCEVIPGVTSAISVPAAVGIPITQRGVVHSFTVVSGHVPPEHPSSRTDFAALAQTGGTIAVIMGVKNCAAICAALQAGGLSADTPAAVIEAGTTAQMRSFRTTLGNLPQVMQEQHIAPPAVYVIGEVAGL